jgi:predicted P-loop ATPase
MSGHLQADREQLGRFVHALFRHAEEGGFVSLRSFEHERGKAPVDVRAVQINGEGLGAVVARATGAANRAARHPRPAVFAPPVCTFKSGSRAAEEDIRNGVALSVECDASPEAARARLHGILRRITVVVASGGEWTDPETGEVQAKLHLHCRLSEPTRTPEEHARLKRCRALATALAGGDPSAVPLVHPLRWPGSVHRKGKPKLCRIVELDEEAEIHLDDAEEALEQAAALALELAHGEAAQRLRAALALGKKGRDRGERQAHDPEERDLDLEALADAIPNDDVAWAEYTNTGLAFYAASDGSAAGFNAWDRWARKSGKHDADDTAAQWEHFHKSPPDRTSKGALVERARRADPAFRLPSWGEKKASGDQDRTGDASWRSDLLTTEKGAPRDCLANGAIILRRDPAFAGKVRFDEHRQGIVCRDMPWRAGPDWREWTDTDDIRLAEWCQLRGVPLKRVTAAEAVAAVADDNRVHPVREYLDGLVWDGKARLREWLFTYIGVTVQERGAEEGTAAARRRTYIREAGRCWMVAAVARIYRAGCKVDTALILEGPQGTGKSSALAAIVPDLAWFADEIADLGGKDAAQDLRGKWIIELAELSAMRRGDIERTKAFMSRATDHYRPSYGRRSLDFPRQCVFAGTTNADAYLADETGNRRFWPVRVGTIDLEALRRDRDQLWAEAVVAFKAGEKWWLDAETEKAAAEEQAERRIADPWEQLIVEWASRQIETVTTTAVLEGAIGLDKGRWSRADEMRVAAILKLHGWERFRFRSAGARCWGFQRGPTCDEGGAEVGPEKANVSAAGPTGPTGPTSFHDCEAAADTVTAGVESAPETLIESVGPGRDVGPPRPAWTDDRAWIDRYRRAPDRDGRINVVLAWGRAAGGTVPDGEALALKLPADLPSCLAANELRRLARDLRVLAP